MVGVARIRLRSIRWKDGRATVRVFRPAEADRSVGQNFATAARRCTEWADGQVMTGWAIVAWSHDESFVNYENGLASRVPASGLPRHVGDVLATEQAVRWSRD